MEDPLLNLSNRKWRLFRRQRKPAYFPCKMAVIGVEFEVRDFATAAQYVGSRAMPPHSEKPGARRLFVPPAGAHGLWLEFHGKPRGGGSLQSAP